MSGLGVRNFLIPLWCVCILLIFPVLVLSQETAPSASNPPLEDDISIPDSNLETNVGDVLEVTIINPFRAANIGADVSGIIEKCYFEEGDYVREGQVIAEISKARYAVQFEKNNEAVNSFQLALKHAEQQVRLFSDLLMKDATTKQELLKAESDRDLAQSRLIQAQKDLEIAKLNLNDCQVRAPFSGHLAFRYKQTFEPVDRLEKILTLVDTSKVYALANVPENRISEFGKGTQASFILSNGKIFHGFVDKVGKVIDVKSKTKRVYVLIDNGRAELEVGMTGSLKPSNSESQ
jgi:RND family efflux transporter MFP subunit